MEMDDGSYKNPQKKMPDVASDGDIWGANINEVMIKEDKLYHIETEVMGDMSND